MFARTVTVQVQPGKIDEAIQIFSSSILPAARQQKGFKGGYLLSDHQTGKGMSVMFWETEADMQAGEASGYLQQQLGKVAPTLAAPSVTERFEVTAQG